jgi:hypothetical protein
MSVWGTSFLLSISNFMKSRKVNATYFGAYLLALSNVGFSQGFQNLNFESAKLSGYSPGSQNVPTSAALPGWSAYFTTSTLTNQVAQNWYDDISLGGVAISVNDTNTGFGFVPIQGRYSAYLFGGSGNGSAVISQTGLVPSGAKSLLMDVNQYFGFIVTLGGQTINMVPLQVFSNYTLYGGDVSSFSSQLSLLSITAPPTGVPNPVLLDNIQFSAESIPEPTGRALFTFGALLLSFFRRQNSRS